MSNKCVILTHSDSRSSYLRIAEPEVQPSKVGEEAEASEKNPVLESGDRRGGGGGGQTRKKRIMLI